MAEKITTRLRDIASGMNAPVNQATLREAADKIESMFSLLLECRDALPAIQLSAARLRGIDLRLADRVEDCIEPWRLPAESQSDAATNAGPHSVAAGVHPGAESTAARSPSDAGAPKT